jgi:ethanolamine ammonia-lyase small subunit
VGVLNDIGELINPAVVVLLIGERPGLATVESLSAYMAFEPRSGHDDSRRNLISNIHGRGVPADQAAHRIAELAGIMIMYRTSGIAIKEQSPLGESRAFISAPASTTVIKATKSIESLMPKLHIPENPC